MFGGAVADLVEFNPLVHLLMQTFSSSAIGWMEGCIVTIGTTATPNPSVTVRTGESGVEHDLLKPLSVFLLEISYKGVISFALWKIKSHRHFPVLNRLLHKAGTSATRTTSMPSGTLSHEAKLETYIFLNPSLAASITLLSV